MTTPTHLLAERYLPVRKGLRIALVCAGVPDGTSSGGNRIPFGLVQVFRNEGHTVEVVDVGGYGVPGVKTREMRVSELGVKVWPVQGFHVEQSLKSRVKAVIRPEMEDLWPVSRFKGFASLLKELRAEVVVAYHFEALAAVQGCGVPVLGLVSDPPGEPDLYRWKRSPGLRSGLELAIRLPRQRKIARSLLDSATSIGAFAAHEAKALGIRHYRIPIPDEYTSRKEGERFRILLMGHLRGIATLTGLDLFAREVLPRLDESFEIHIAGGYELPPRLKKKLTRPNVVFRGQIEENVTEELEKAHVLCVPTPIPLGCRVRILHGWMAGCPVVAHEANALGIPEMLSLRNSVLLSNGHQMAVALRRLREFPELRKDIGREGRQTWKAHYSPETAGQMILNEVKALAHAGKRA